MYLLFVLAMTALALVLLTTCKSPLRATVIAAGTLVMLCSHNAHGQPVRNAARRVVQLPVRVLDRTLDAVENTVEAVTPIRFARYERVVFVGMEARSNPRCDCENCDCINCDCGEEESPVVGQEATIDTTHDERRMVDAINRYRATHGRPPLVVDATLMQMARARVGVFHHRHPRYGWAHEHGRRLGYVATDNIAQGYPTPESAVGDNRSGWGDERAGHTVGHNRQMLGYIKRDGTWHDLAFDRVGVARSGANYIAVFGRRS